MAPIGASLVRSSASEAAMASAAGQVFVPVSWIAG